MITVRYKGFRIVARPYQIAEAKHWTSDLEIRRRGRGQAFSAQDRHASQLEADAECHRLGREIIDGVIPGWSVDRLRSAGRWAFLRFWEARPVRMLRGLRMGRTRPPPHRADPI